MPAPATADELLDLIQRSGVADENRLKTYVKKLSESSGIPSDPQKFAGVLVRDGLLTIFQAEQLLQGKYKRFTIGKYKVLEKLGAGGMAQVFLCEHKLMRRRVAIKVLPTQKADDPSSLERFYREARAVAAVDHPNIVRAYDIDQDDTLHFLVMEYVDGTNLQDLVKKSGPLDVLRSCHYIYAATVGLQHAHEMGLIHRDIKPGNILLDRAGVVKILDMGLARFFHDEDDELTKKYDENVLGTADYLAPEQALDSHAVDIRADIYSLGATFYYLLTGSAPFPEGSVAQKLIWHQNRPPRPITSIRAEVPPEVVAIVNKMMAKKAEDRYQTPAEVMAAIAPWVASPISPPTEKEMPQVSLAAGGSGGRGPASMVAPVLTTVARNPATPALATPFPPIQTTPVAACSPEAAAAAQPGSQAVWEALDEDIETQSVARGDTDRPANQPGSSTRKRRPGTLGTGDQKRLLYVALGLLILACAAAGAYFAFFKKSGEPEQPVAEVRKIVVGEGDNAVATLREALSKAGPGDTIVIAKPLVSEPTLRLDRNRHKNLTIEGGLSDGALPVIEAKSVLPVLFDMNSVEGVHLKNLEFDGKGTQVGVQVSGACPGLTIEGVTVRSIRSTGFRFSNVSGEDARPILMDRVRVQVIHAAQTAVLLEGANADTRRVTIRNSRFECLAPGPSSGVGLRIDGPTTDLEISGNRFFNLETAISFAKPPVGKSIRGQVTSNTIVQATAGLLFDFTAPPGNLELTINQNYFAKTAEIGKGVGGNPPAAGVTAIDNGHGPECNAGNVSLNAVPVPNAPVLPADPANDATFLRFPGGPPELAPGKPRVGAK